MKKFTLVFILVLLTISFVAVFVYFSFNKTTIAPKLQDQASTEEIQQDVTEQVTNLGPSIYEDYTKEVYDRALKENRVMALYFTANWCPICREQEPVNQKVFESLDKSGVVGLRVHILDSETTDETDALAKKFDVVYQHTFVILDSTGTVFYKYTGPLEEAEVRTKILEAVNIKGEVVI